jgi:hypothetical protein
MSNNALLASLLLRVVLTDAIAGARLKDFSAVSGKGP